MKPTIKTKRRSEAQPRSAGRSKTRLGLWFKAKVQQHARQAMMRKTKTATEENQGKEAEADKDRRKHSTKDKGRSKAGSSNGSINRYH
jgi:hypothetical protein